jgi:hypothetical protein
MNLYSLDTPSLERNLKAVTGGTSTYKLGGWAWDQHDSRGFREAIDGIKVK